MEGFFNQARAHPPGPERPSGGAGRVSALDLGDVDVEEQTVLIRRSKTEQEGRGAVQFLGDSTTKRIRA